MLGALLATNGREFALNDAALPPRRVVRAIDALELQAEGFVATFGHTSNDEVGRNATHTINLGHTLDEQLLLLEGLRIAPESRHLHKLYVGTKTAQVGVYLVAEAVEDGQRDNHHRQRQRNRYGSYAHHHRRTRRAVVLRRTFGKCVFEIVHFRKNLYKVR